MPFLSISVVLAAIIVGSIRGGRLNGLTQSRWVGPALPLLALVLQVLAFLPDENASPATRAFAATAHIASYGLLLEFARLNRRATWMTLIAAGIALNALAIVANGGFMPVSPEAAAGTGSSGEAVSRGIYNNSVRMSEGTRLPFLGDIFRAPDGMPFSIAFSAGDLLIALGGFALVQRLMVRPRARAAEGRA